MARNVANARRHALLGATALAVTTVFAACLAAAAADSPAVASPDAPPQGESQPAPALQESGKLQMITVTAERYVSNVQQTPIAITVLSGGGLQRQGITDLQSAISTVPALHVQASPQGAQLYIRGVGTNGDSNWVDPDVALMFDGLYSGRAEAALSSLYDVNRIEVLKGPQGTLYGRNAVGGVINIDTNDPVIGRYEAGADLGTGNYRLMHADGYLNLPVSDTLAIRLAAERETHSGYYSNGGGAEHMVSTRLKALWEPSDDWSVLGTINYWHEQGIAETTVSTSNAPWATAAYASYDTYRPDNPWYVGPLALGPPGAATVAQLLPNDDNYEFLTYSLKAQWNLGWASLVLLPGYSYSNRYTLTQLFAPGPREPTTWWERQYSGEARLVSPTDSVLKWVAGVYVLSTDETTAGVPAGGATFLDFPPSDHPARSVAEFGQITYPITSKLRLIGGIRYTRDEKRLTYSVCTSDDGASCNGVYASPVTALSDSYSASTYKAGLQYDLRRESMLYADVATGYKAGGYQLTDPPLTYKPEKLTAYEIGSKNRFLDDRLQLNAALYYYRYEDYQVEYQAYVPYTTTLPPQYIPSGSGEEFTQFVANAGTGRNVGGEIGLKYRLTRHDQLDIDLAYVDARYGNLTVPTSGGPPGTTNTSGFFDFDGQPVANTPRQSATLGYEHDWSAYGGLLSLRLQSKVSAGYYASADEWFAGGAVWQPGFTRSSAFLSYLTPDGAWNVDLWARNLENHAQITYIYPFYRAELSDPRTFGVTLGYRFQ
ncbi:MAG: TonB-dependent receptor [Steroidobacteraceae bacterium]